MDDVICDIFLALFTVVAEFVIESCIMHMWLKGSSPTRELLILS